MTSDIDDILEKTIRQTINKSIIFKISTKFYGTESGARASDSTLRVDAEYYQDSAGRRYLDERSYWATGRRFRWSSYCDGKVTTSVTYRPNSLDLQHIASKGLDFANESQDGFVRVPEPLRWYHAGMTPLHEALPASEPMGESKVIGRRCRRFHFKNVGPETGKQSLVYHIDVETGVPLKVVAYANTSMLRADVPNWAWEAISVDNFGDRSFPDRSMKSVYKHDSNGRLSLTNYYESILTELKFDEPIPKSLFAASLQPGVTVADVVGKKTYVVPGKRAEEPLSAEALAAVPIRVEPNAPGSFGPFGVYLGLAILAIAGLLGWKKSRSGGRR